MCQKIICVCMREFVSARVLKKGRQLAGVKGSNLRCSLLSKLSCPHHSDAAGGCNTLRGASSQVSVRAQTARSPFARRTPRQVGNSQHVAKRQPRTTPEVRAPTSEPDVHTVLSTAVHCLQSGEGSYSRRLHCSLPRRPQACLKHSDASRDLFGA